MKKLVFKLYISDTLNIWGQQIHEQKFQKYGMFTLKN